LVQLVTRYGVVSSGNAMQTTKSLKGLCSSILSVSLLALLVLIALDVIRVNGQASVDVGNYPLVAAVMAVGSLIARCVLESTRAG